MQYIQVEIIQIMLTKNRPEKRFIPHSAVTLKVLKLQHKEVVKVR